MGSIVDVQSGAPVANAMVKAISPTAVIETRTNAKGFFAFISMTPDTYTLTVEARDYEPISMGNVAVFADQVQAVKFAAYPRLVSITDARPHLYVYALGIAPGVTTDVYRHSAGNRWAPVPYMSNALVIRLTPGVSTGPGAPVTH